MGPPHRVSATVTATPDRTNGTASDAVETAMDRISITEPVAIGRNGTVRFTTCEAGTVHANHRATRASSAGARSVENCSGRLNTKTAPAAIPSIASDTARNDRWYQVRTESNLASRVSSSRVERVRRNRPRNNQGIEALMVQFSGSRPAVFGR